MMNILYVSSIYPPSIGGAQLQLHCLAKGMQEAGEGVQALTYTSRNREDWLRFTTIFPEAQARYEHEGVPVTQLGFPLQARLRMAPWAMAYYAAIPLACKRIAGITESYLESLIDDPPELIHLTRIGREFIARACLDYARKRDIPFILTPNHHPRWRGWRYVEYDKIYREADALIVYTEAEREILSKDIGVDAARIHVTGVGPLVSEDYDIEAFRTSTGLQGPYVLILGQQYKYKGIKAVLNAAPKVWEEHPEMRFLFIGPPTHYSRDLFKTVTDPRILNLGAVDAATKAAALAACELLCLPSSQESFGGVYIEAWCYRKACIGGNIPAIACVIDHGENGLLSSQDPSEVAGALLSLLSDPDRCKAMGEQGYKKMQQRYSWRRITEKTRKIYQQVLAG